MTSIERIACVLAQLSPSELASLLSRLPSVDRIRLSAIRRTKVQSNSFKAQHAPKREKELDPNTIIQQFVLSAESKVGNSVRLEHITQILQVEQPRTVAAALSMMSPALSAEILAAFPAAYRKSVIQAIIESGPVSKEALEDIVDSIRPAVSVLWRASQSDHGGTDLPFPKNRGLSTSTEWLREMLAAATPKTRLLLSSSIQQADSRTASLLALNRSA